MCTVHAGTHKAALAAVVIVFVYVNRERELHWSLGEHIGEKKKKTVTHNLCIMKL
jgi:hypothetical protein